MSEVETQETPEKREKPEIITVYVVDGFVVMFTSLSMIMLAFFIMLNALAIPDEKREKAAIGSLMGAFGVLPEGVGLDETGSYMASLDYVSMRDEMVLFAAFEAFLDEDWHTQEILSYVDEDGRRRIRFTESFLFDSGSEKLDPKMYPVLDRLAAMLRTLERPIIVEGHTDSKQGRPSNWRLSAHRAGEVTRYFAQTGAMPNAKLTALGCGDGRPAFPDPADPRNRRVEIVVH